jgi:hypothetical protein
VSVINSFPVDRKSPAVIVGKGADGVLTFQAPTPNWTLPLRSNPPSGYVMGGMLLDVDGTVISGPFSIVAGGTIVVPVSTNPDITITLHQNTFSYNAQNAIVTTSLVVVSATQSLTSGSTAPWTLDISLFGQFGTGLQGEGMFEIDGTVTDLRTSLSAANYNPTKTPSLQLSLDVLFSSQSNLDVFTSTLTSFFLKV